MKENTFHDKKVYEAIVALAGSSTVEKPTALNMDGCYSFGGGLVQVEGFASVLPSTLELVKIKATVIGKSDSITTVAIGDVLTEADLTLANKRNCCPL
jgi:hypothetical protein